MEKTTVLFHRGAICLGLALVLCVLPMAAWAQGEAPPPVENRQAPPAPPPPSGDPVPPAAAPDTHTPAPPPPSGDPVPPTGESQTHTPPPGQTETPTVQPPGTDPPLPEPTAETEDTATPLPEDTGIPAETALAPPTPEPSESPTARVYTVLFVDWSGVVIASAEVPEGTAVSAPGDPPAREGYTFAFWSLEQPDGDGAFQPYAFDTLLTGDQLALKLIARYVENAGEETAQPTVTPFSQEGTQVVLHSSLAGQSEVTEGTQMVLTADLLGFEGYTPTIHWQCSADGSHWETVSVGQESSLTIQLFADNAQYFWRARITP